MKSPVAFYRKAFDGDVVEFATHFDVDPFRRSHVKVRFADASRGLFNHRLFAAIIWRGNLRGFSKSTSVWPLSRFKVGLRRRLI